MSGSINSTVATYTGGLDYNQTIFASSADAKNSGLKKNASSYNNKEGKCANCNGYGQVKISMDFMEDVWNLCDNCGGYRYNDEVLSVKLDGYSVADSLLMIVVEACEFFSLFTEKTSKRIVKILKQLKEIGLGHLKLGQITASLSGGESQRLKLSANLQQSKGEKILFLLFLLFYSNIITTFIEGNNKRIFPSIRDTLY